jgi:hypothetical protein
MLSLSRPRWHNRLSIPPNENAFAFLWICEGVFIKTSRRSYPRHVASSITPTSKNDRKNEEKNTIISDFQSFLLNLSKLDLELIKYLQVLN